MKNTGQYDLFSKKEVAKYERERKKLEKNLSGIKDMGSLPDALFVIDTNLEAIAIQEASKLGIPIIGVADTNCDPDDIDFIIPGNDDALRAIRLITDTMSQAYLDGKSVYEAQQKELTEQMEKQRQLQAQQAAAAREAAAARNASNKESAEQGAATGEVAPAGDASPKPKTMVRKALQRKPKTRRPDAASSPAEGSATSNAAEEPESLPEAEGERPE
jgi:hypothetical protein